MRTLLIALLIITLYSCNQEPEASIQDNLSGMWSYEPVKLFGDTISTQMNIEFNPIYKETKIHTIRTDSGVFQHHYANEKLVWLRAYDNLWIQEITFDNDTTGHLVYYEIDTSKTYSMHPRDIANSWNFEFYQKNKDYVFILNNAYMKDTLTVKSVLNDELIYKGSELVYSKIKYSNADSTRNYMESKR